MMGVRTFDDHVSLGAAVAWPRHRGWPARLQRRPRWVGGWAAERLFRPSPRQACSARRRNLTGTVPSRPSRVQSDEPPDQEPASSRLARIRCGRGVRQSAAGRVTANARPGTLTPCRSPLDALCGDCSCAWSSSRAVPAARPPHRRRVPVARGQVAVRRCEPARRREVTPPRRHASESALEPRCHVPEASQLLSDGAVVAADSETSTLVAVGRRFGEDPSVGHRPPESPRRYGGRPGQVRHPRCFRGTPPYRRRRHQGGALGAYEPSTARRQSCALPGARTRWQLAVARVVSSGDVAAIPSLWRVSPEAWRRTSRPSRQPRRRRRRGLRRRPQARPLCVAVDPRQHMALHSGRGRARPQASPSTRQPRRARPGRRPH